MCTPRFFASGRPVESEPVEPTSGWARLERREHVRNGLIAGYSVWTLRPDGQPVLQGRYSAAIWDDQAEAQSSLHYHQLLGLLR